MSDTSELPSWDQALGQSATSGDDSSVQQSALVDQNAISSDQPPTPAASNQNQPLPSWDEAVEQNKPGIGRKVVNAFKSTVGDVGQAVGTTLKAAGEVAVQGLESYGGYNQNEPIGPATQEFLKNTTIGRVMSAFGQAYDEGTSSYQNLGITPGSETEKWLQKSGLMKDYVNNEQSFRKSLIGGVITSAAAALDATMRTGGGALSGSFEAVGQAVEETGVKGARHGAGELAEFVQNVPVFPILDEAKQSVFTYRDMQKATASGVTSGEDVYFGLKDPEPEQAATIKTAQDQVAASEPALAPEAPPAPDIHEVARQTDPETFGQYDQLDRQRESIRGQLDDLSDARDQAHAGLDKGEDQLRDEQATIQTSIDALNNKKKLTPANQAKLDDLQTQIQTLDDQLKYKTGVDTPEMAALRKQLQDTDYQMRDMAPKVSAAYRAAQEKIANEPTPQPQEQGAQPELAKEPDLAVQQQMTNIQSDMSKQLQAAGRPAEEADAVSQLVAAHYKSVVDQGWVKDLSPEEAYKRDMANVKAGRGVVAAGDELSQQARGKIRLASDDAKANITLMKSANASTFIHETGHHWLDEMMRYASADDAPAQLTKDANTVRDWLGAKQGEDIARRQHEKFARGFERYAMEGVAPSPELATVFAKFKQWLTDIYQSVLKLRAPISDDIRDVFDRLLTAQPERTVVAPERAPGKAMADIHESDALHTPPEHAEQAADMIRQEMKRTAKAHNEGVHNAITAAEEAGPIQEGAEDATGTGTAEPRPADAGTTGEPSAINTGRNEPTSEGDVGTAGPAGAADATSGANTGSAGSPASGKPIDADAITDTSSKSEPEGPHDDLGRSGSGLVDKAGNIRLDKMNAPEDVKEVIRQTATENNDFLPDRRGVIPVSEQLRLADALGMTSMKLNFRKIGEAFNAEQIRAAVKLLDQSAAKVAELASGDDVAAYAEARDRHKMIQGQVSGITAEAGRALGALKRAAGDQTKALGEILKATDNADLFQLQQEMGFVKNLKTPAQVSAFMESTKKATFKQQMLEYYINALISGPITHTRYAFGNALNALITPVFETPLAAASGSIREFLGKDVQDRVYWGEAGAQIQALYKGSQDGLRAAATAWRTNMSPLLPGEDYTPEIKTNAIPGKLGTAINIPSKGVSAIHSFFKSLRYEQRIQALAFRTATKEGLEGEAFSNRVADLSVTPTDEMMKSLSEKAAQGDERAQETLGTLNSDQRTANESLATQESLKELYMAPTEYNSTMGALNRAINSNMAAKIIVPFMKIGSQITRNAFMERTPLGFFSKEIRDNLLGLNGGSALDEQLGKIATGTAIMGSSSLMVMSGLATGDGPTDPDQRRIWLLNHKPNSMQIGDITIPYQGLGHYGMLMRFAANMTETAQGWNEEDGDKLGVAFLEGITKSVLDENFMRGIKDALDAMYHYPEYGPRYLQSFATNWLPYSVGLSQIDRQIDPYQRDVRSHGWENGYGILDQARAKIPFVSEGLEPRRDSFGQPIPNGGQVQNYNQDPVVQRMDALQIKVGRLDRKIMGVPLSDQQYDDYSRIAGVTAKMRLDSLVNMNGFQNLPNGTQIELIHKSISTSRSDARSIILMQNQDLIRAATQKKIDAAK